MNAPPTLPRYFQARLPQALELLKHMVELESHSLDKSGVDAFAAFLAREFEQRGAKTTILQQPVRGNQLKAFWDSGRAAKPVLMLGHLDTVWPPGSTQIRPFRIEDGRAYGPGVFDMKAGILLCLLICGAFRDAAAVPARNVVFLFTSDEEIGTEAGLELLRMTAGECHAVLCLEPPLPGGAAKTFRKGVGTFTVKVRGRAAHAGVDHAKGANAIQELCRIVLQAQSMTDYERGITINAGTIRGGTASNVVPDEAEAEIDFRVPSLADSAWVEDRIRRLGPLDPRCTVEITGGLNRPPLERSDAVLRLYGKARSAALALGIDLGEGPSGGGSDGSFTAAMGIPTLDGLGCSGDGAHAGNEHVEVADVPRRAAFLCRLLQDLE